MAIQSSNEFSTDAQALNFSADLKTDRLTEIKITIRIPKRLHAEPVISKLVSQHSVTVNIAAALLSANQRDDGWFELEIQGTSQHIHSALAYLNELDLEIWGLSTSEYDGW